MKILFFVYVMSHYGAQKATANLANHWASCGKEIIILSMDDRDLHFIDLHPKIRRISINVTGKNQNTFFKILYNIKRIYRVRKILKEEKPEFAIGIGRLESIILAIAAKKLKNIITIGSERTHPPMFPMGRINEKLRIMTYPWLDTVTVFVQKNADWLHKNIKNTHVSIIPNAVSRPASSHGRDVEREMLFPKQKDTKILLSVGRLELEKGHDILIDVFSRLVQKYPDWMLVIVGEGSQECNLKKRARDKNIADLVFFPGHVENISQWYEASDLYVFPSRFEGFPNALIEAMAHGLAPISFDCDTGPADIIDHKINGLLIPPENAIMLQEALARLMGDQTLRAKFAAQAVQVQDRFSMERVSKMWDNLFASMKANAQDKSKDKSKDKNKAKKEKGEERK